MSKPTHLVAHLHFFKHTEPNKKCKRATKPTHQETAIMDGQQHDRKEGQHLTAVWRNGGCSAKLNFRISNKHLC